MKPQLIYLAVFGATICGSAFAISVDDRQAFCNQYPDKYVWVEKTQACVPINPCNSTIQNIRDAYCVQAPFYADSRSFEKIIKNGYNTDISSDAGSVRYFDSNAAAYYTTDGYYYMFMPTRDGKVSNEFQGNIQAACWANSMFSDTKDEESDLLPDNKMLCFPLWGSASESNCTNAADFASTLTGVGCIGKLIQSNSSENFICEMTCNK